MWMIMTISYAANQDLICIIIHVTSVHCSVPRCVYTYIIFALNPSQTVCATHYTPSPHTPSPHSPPFHCIVHLLNTPELASSTSSIRLRHLPVLCCKLLQVQLWGSADTSLCTISQGFIEKNICSLLKCVSFEWLIQLVVLLVRCIKMSFVWNLYGIMWIRILLPIL